jgi:hypothetical protein
MRQSHAGGDKLFFDYAGYTAPVIIDRLTGETRLAQISVPLRCGSARASRTSSDDICPATFGHR